MYICLKHKRSIIIIIIIENMQHCALVWRKGDFKQNSVSPIRKRIQSVETLRCHLNNFKTEQRRRSSAIQRRVFLLSRIILVWKYFPDMHVSKVYVFYLWIEVGPSLTNILTA